MAFCSCFGTGIILRLTDCALWGLCASAETTGALYEYTPASAGSSRVRADTGLLAGHHSARTPSWALLKCSKFLDPVLTCKQWDFKEVRNCSGFLIPSVLASVWVYAMGVLCPCVQGMLETQSGKMDRLCGGYGVGRLTCEGLQVQEVRLRPALQGW